MPWLPEIGIAPNAVSAALMGAAIFGGLLGLRKGLDHVWTRVPDASRNRVESVLRFLFGDKIAVTDALALIIFVEAAIAVGITIAGLSVFAALVAMILTIALPMFFYARASGKRAHELELALPMSLQQVANEMAAGATLETALKKVTGTAPAPADIEIARLQRRVEIMGIDAAFSEMAEQLDSRSFTLTASVVRVGTSSGGQLVAALKNLSRTLIEIERLNKKLRTASENGRRNLYLMSLVGPIVAFGSNVSVDHQVSVMDDGLGQVLMGLSVLSFFAAHAIGYALTKVKV